jgi:predicted ribosomally synthesized peptide with SipW-like signal peptide
VGGKHTGKKNVEKEKKMKKRIALVGLSIVLVFSLAIGGTLMLFTAESNTATNVVTTGTASIMLQEYDATAGDYVDVAADTVFNLDGKAIAGDPIVKRPKVENTGDTAVYLYVEVEFVMPDGLTALEKAAVAANSEISFAHTGEWFGVEPTVTGDRVVGGFFYTDPQGKKLQKLDSGTESSDVFSSVTFKKLDLPSRFSVDGADIKIKVKAYGLQANGFEIASELRKDWQDAFEAEFGTLNYFK